MRNSWGLLLLLMPGLAWADLSGTVTVAAGSGLNLETGAVGASGGDILYTGAKFQTQGSAKAIDAGNVQLFGFNEFDLAVLHAYSPGLLSGSYTAAQGDVLVVLTNAGHYAKILIQAISPSSATLQYLTYGAAAAPTGPVISAVQNNYSYLQAGLPNYGIAPGSLFIIKGTDLASATTAALQSTLGGGIPTTLNGASISVTVNGVTTHPGIYYAIATQIAAVLPSSTPAGSGTIIVTYNGQPSSPEPILVVPTALGLDTYYGTGTGLGVATDPVSGVPYFFNNSAKPGQTIVLWGSGLGATSDSDVAYTSPPKAVNVPLQIFIGGIPATISYQGGSGYPGLNQINVTIPSSVSPGCGVSIVAMSGSIVSNVVTIPVEPGGGACSDPVIDGTAPYSPGSSYHSGTVTIVQATGAGSTSSSASAVFLGISGLPNATDNNGLYSFGSCTASQSVLGAVNPLTQVGLDPGVVTLTGPSGTQTLAAVASYPGDFGGAMPAGFIPATGGTFTFTGTGGKDVGPFAGTLHYTNPIVWTNEGSISGVTRSQGVTVTWSGGDPNSYVLISGGSSSPGSTATQIIGAGFVCYAPVSAGQFTIPPSILLGMPIGQGSLTVENTTTPVVFNTTGLDYFTGFVAYYFSLITPYQ